MSRDSATTPGSQERLITSDQLATLNRVCETRFIPRLEWSPPHYYPYDNKVRQLPTERGLFWLFQKVSGPYVRGRYELNTRILYILLPDDYRGVEWHRTRERLFGSVDPAGLEIVLYQRTPTRSDPVRLLVFDYDEEMLDVQPENTVPPESAHEVVQDILDAIPEHLLLSHQR